MKTFFDDKLLTKVVFNPSFFTKETSFEITLPWPSLLKYLDLGSLLESLSIFDEKNTLFKCLISPLNLDKDIVVRLYDQIFIECLTLIKSLPEINPDFLLQKLEAKEKHSFLSSSLHQYQKRLKEKPYEAIHDLILYLAFDLVCIWLSQLFEHPSSKEGIIETLKECLIESFSHIKQDGKTSPGFFRLIEALYAYQMKEENLQKHSNSEWLILCESASALKSRQTLIDLFYIDAAIENKEKEITPMQMFTTESPDIIKARIALASYMIQKIKLEFPKWNYTLHPFSINPI